MFNKNLFKAKIVERGFNTADIAKLLGINEATLYRKISGVSDFTRNEIQLFRVAVSLSIEDVDAIFFSHQLT